MIIETDLDNFKSLILAGKTIKELQDIFNMSRSAITESKRKYGLVGISPNSKKIDKVLGEKLCTACKELKPLDSFHSNGKTPAGTQKYKSVCSTCSATHKKSDFYSFIMEYLQVNDKEYKCEKCGDTDQFGFLHFHHIDPSTKVFSIGQMRSIITSFDSFIEQMVPELSKCSLLCPSCHVREHLLMGLN